ncbi:MAG: 2-vinyl bacteriochlorophyllide hydratase [Pseudomonadota bacterium]
MYERSRNGPVRSPLYTKEERARRDATVWTTVQGVLAPLQFGVFLVSLVLILRYVSTGDGYAIATLSIVAKTAILYAIMVTGSIWEKVVFGRWLFAPAFFWEDVFSFVVIALHTLYLYILSTGYGGPPAQMAVAFAAYAAYAVNAGQFLWKLRAARLEAEVAA